jgi:Protein of unknown function (DUF2961)
MKRLTGSLLLAVLLTSCYKTAELGLYEAPPPHTHTRWVSPENPDAEKGEGGQSNRGAKGNAFFIVPPGAQQVLLEEQGAGIIRRIWMSGTIPRNEEQRRLVRLDMYWDGAAKPAVSVPIGDFFGVGLGLTASHESAYFSNPESKSFNCAIPMPFRKAAKIVITNESSSYALVWYDINYLKMKRLPKNVLYFHSFWNRQPKTELGVDYEVLPKVEGKGRYLGCNIGVAGDSIYRGTWFGEGEVKVFLDGDKDLPTLVGTGTEDYIGTGWGQGEFRGQWQGSTISDSQRDFYTFYRFHGPDPVYFHENCRVTIQQIGNSTLDKVRDLATKHPADVKPVWVFDFHNASDIMRLQGLPPEQLRLLEPGSLPGFFDPAMPSGSVNFYRRDDVSATAYFYLDKPSSNLPGLPGKELRAWMGR